ncbi:MAG TPA: thioredoxin domain-containing protein [Candidatus Paceibacterota bacterium]|nr:thioredoxin domain-containing protein [Candidatus Paceibacterota bacterium]
MRPAATIPIAIVAAGIIIAAAVYVTVSKNHGAAAVADNPGLIRPVESSDHIFGNPAAPVKIIEYSDFDCAYCKGFNDTLHEVIATEGANGSVAWVFREFPLTQVHPASLKLAEAAECAATVGGNGAFWKFADTLFANQPVSPSDFGALAAAVGLSGSAFASCYANASSTVDARIKADSSNALSMGAHGTPYSIILAPDQPPVVMDGAYSYDAVRQLVDAALAAIASSTAP